MINVRESHAVMRSTMERLLESSPGPLQVDHDTARDFQANVINLAQKLVEDEEPDEARYLLQGALRLFPTSAVLYACLGEVELDEAMYEQAIPYLEHARELGADDANSARYLAVAYECLGQFEDADAVWRRYFPQGSVEPEPGALGLPRLLVLVTPLCGNIQFRNFIHPEDFIITRFFVESYHDNVVLPDCNAIFVAIANPELCDRALQKAKRIIQKIGKPYINDPDRIRASGRIDTTARLRGMPGVVLPYMRVIERTAPIDPSELPILLRAQGYHGGRKFALLDALDALPGVLERLPGRELLSISYIDTRHVDGTWRKYRVLAIDGILYPLHLAIAFQWNVHYFSAAMADHPEFRAEEERFLQNMHAALGAKAMSSLAKIFDTLVLDYVGIDFALDREGNVVVYEANAAMVIAAADDGEQWDYRRPAIARAIEAAKRMTLKRASSSTTQ